MLPKQTDPTATGERHERLGRRYFEEVWNQGHVDVLDELLAHWRVTDELTLTRQLGVVK